MAWIASIRVATGATRRMWLGTLGFAIHDTGDKPSFAVNLNGRSRLQPRRSKCIKRRDAGNRMQTVFNFIWRAMSRGSERQVR